MTTDTLPDSGRNAEFLGLKKLIDEAGLLERRPGYYAVKITVTLLLYLAGFVAVVVIGKSWWNLVTAAYLAVMYAQVALLGHDAGHQQIFDKKKSIDYNG